MDKTNHELKHLIKKSLDKLYFEDKDLLKLRGIEMSLVFRFGVYFQEFLNETKFKNLNVDCEYNKNLEDKKRTPFHPKGIRPDFILHQRGSHKKNTLAIECKGNWSRSQSIPNDRRKLEELTKKSGEYGYTLGAFVVFDSDKYHIEYFVDGEKEHTNEDSV